MPSDESSKQQRSDSRLTVSKVALGAAILAFIGGLLWNHVVLATLRGDGSNFAVLIAFALASLALLVRSFFPRMSVSVGLVTYFGGFLLGLVFSVMSGWGMVPVLLGIILIFLAFVSWRRSILPISRIKVGSVPLETQPISVRRLLFPGLILVVSLPLALWHEYSLIFNWTFSGAQFIPASQLMVFTALAGISVLTIVHRMGWEQDRLLRWVAALGLAIACALLSVQFVAYRSVRLVSTMLSPVVRSLETSYSRHGFFPLMLSAHLLPAAPFPKLENLEYRTDGLCFALGTRGGSYDIEGGRIYYDSGIRRWKTDTRLRDIAYSCDVGPLSRVISEYHWDSKKKVWSIPFGAAVEQEVVGAKASLGEWFLNKNEFSSAYPLLKDAADAGDNKAMEMMGDVCFNGWGTSRDYQQAFDWYRKSSGPKHPSASRKLGQMYLSGLGTKQDRDEAVKFLRLAAQEGDKIAEQELERTRH